MLKAEYDLEMADKGGFLIGSKVMNIEWFTADFKLQIWHWDEVGWRELRCAALQKPSRENSQKFDT